MRNNSFSDLHDAEIVEVITDKDRKSLRISFAVPKRETVTLNFEGVVTFRICDFVTQNVVSRVLVSSEYAFMRDDLAKWVRWSISLSDGSCFVSDDQVQAYIKKLESHEICLSVLEPSWGAEVAVLSEKAPIVVPAAEPKAN